MGFPGLNSLTSKIPFLPNNNGSTASNGSTNTPQAQGPTTKDTFTAGAPQIKPKVDLNGGSVSTSETVSGNASNGNVGVSGSVKVDANIDSKVKHDNGYTTVTIAANASVTAKGSLDIKAVSIGGSVSDGANVTYQVRMKDSDYEKLKAGQIPPPNSFDASTIPDGGSVRLDQSQFQGTSLEVGFKYNAAKLGISGDVKDTKGTSLLVQRDGDKVQVTAGPTDVLQNNASVKLSAGPASIELGNNTTLSDVKLATAQFDLSTPGGKAAYEQFQKDGKLPDAEGPGVSNVETVENVDFKSATDLKAKLGFSVDLGGQTNSGHMTVTTHADGTKDLTAHAQDGTGPKTSVTRSYDAQGNELKAKTRPSSRFASTRRIRRRERSSIWPTATAPRTPSGSRSRGPLS